MRLVHVVPACLLFCLACEAESPDFDEPGPVEQQPAPDPRPAFADEVIEAPSASDEDFGDPTMATNGVRGQGHDNGSTDVFSLTHDVGRDFVTLAWSGRRIVDGPGDDFKVFENPFHYPGGQFMDQIVVYLSVDGTTWVPFPHDYVADDETTYLDDPALWQGFAGLSTFSYHEEENPLPVFDADAGGDGFDLARLDPNDAQARAIIEDGFSFIRLVSASSELNPDTGALFVHDRFANGPDIDGVYARYFVPRRNR